MDNLKDSKDLLMQYGYPQRIIVFFGLTLGCLLIAAVAMGVVTLGGVTTLTLRLCTILQDVLLFVVPAVITAMIVTKRPAELLAITRGVNVNLLIVVVLTFIVSLPAMNSLVAWNESLTLPSSMSSIEEWMRASENKAKNSVEILLGGTSIGDLVMGLLIVGCLAGFSEEIFFRGGLQRLLSSGPMNPHLAVWLTAVIFSVFHVQFFGFFPRLFLGAYFGYLLLWSRSVWLPVFAHVLNNSTVVYASWLHRRAEAAGVADDVEWINSIGSDSVWMVLLSLILVGLCLVALKRISSVRE